MWTRAKLKSWAESRGHSVPKSRVIQHALLAHERYWKRTAERNVDRVVAKQALDAALDRLQESDIPGRKPSEYPGMTEFRLYAQERHRARAERRAREQGAEAVHGVQDREVPNDASRPDLGASRHEDVEADEERTL